MFIKSLISKNFYKDNSYKFTGYKLVTNRVERLYIHDNQITVLNGVAPSLFQLASIRGLCIEDNEINASKTYESSKLGDEEIYGASLSANCTTIEHLDKNFVVLGTSKNTTVPIVMTGGEADIEAFCTAASATVTFSAGEGGKIERRAEADGVLYVEPAADEGYVFDGYYLDGAKIEDARFEFGTTTTVEVRFVAE